jgi:hypothetical protein
MVHIVKKGGEGPMVPSHLNFIYVGDSLCGGEGSGGVNGIEVCQTNTKDNTSTPLH